MACRPFASSARSCWKTRANGTRCCNSFLLLLVIVIGTLTTGSPSDPVEISPSDFAARQQQATQSCRPLLLRISLRSIRPCPSAPSPDKPNSPQISEVPPPIVTSRHSEQFSKCNNLEIGRASCRERVEISVVGGTRKRKKQKR